MHFSFHSVCFGLLDLGPSRETLLLRPIMGTRFQFVILTLVAVEDDFLRVFGLPLDVRDYREVLNLTWTGTLTAFFATQSTLTHSFATEGNFVNHSSASAARR
jgi:hypothetical protein